MNKSGMWMVTASGVEFNFGDPKPEMVRLDDIAHALGMICRFGGHAHRFYSVAEHCLVVGKIVHDLTEGDHNATLYGMLHDAAEAYVGDVVRPIKRSISGYDDIEARVESVIYEALGLPMPDEATRGIVKQADLIALVTERGQLTTNTPTPWVEDRLGVKPHPVKVNCYAPEYARVAYKAGVSAMLKMRR